MRLTQQEAAEQMLLVTGVCKVLTDLKRHVFKLSPGALCIEWHEFPMGRCSTTQHFIVYMLLNEEEYEEELKANEQFGVGT